MYKERGCWDATGFLPAQLQKASMSFVMSVRPSVMSVCPHGTNSAPTGRIFIRLDILLFFENLLRDNDVNNQRDATNFSFINLFKSALHFFYIHGSVHRDSILIRSNKMQQ